MANLPIPLSAWPLLTPPDLEMLSTDITTSAPVVKNWSSLIGIITAICGNILISFALNTQRYAHMRIRRERDEKEEEEKVRSRKREVGKGYGTIQADVAEERRKANVGGGGDIEESYAAREGGEREALIPRVDSPQQEEARKSTRGNEHEHEHDDNDDNDGDDTNEKDEEGNIKSQSYLSSPIWWAGITMMTLGETGNFLAYGFAPASIVSPLGVVALVSNCLIAPWLLHEKFRWRDGIGVIIAVAGCVTVVLSASSSNPQLDPDEIWRLITNWEFETYLGVTVILILILMVASSRIGEKSILIDLGLMGLFGGYTALSTKGVASLLSTSIWRVVTFPITYLLLAVLISTAVLQIKYVNRALQRFDSTQVIPTQFVLFTLSVIIGSAVLYRDFERTTPEQAIKFIGGCALTFLGVWCITSGRDDGSDNDEEMGEEDDGIDLVDEEGVQPEIRERENVPSLLPSSSKRTSDTGAIADLSELQEQSSDLPPAATAAIHSDTFSSIPAATSKSPNKPPMHATTSDPTIPRLNVSAPSDSTPNPSTPTTPTRTRAKRNYSTIEPTSKLSANSDTTILQTQQQHTPDIPPTHTTPTPRRPQLQPKRSLVSSFNPLTSPLSSSLSAIVADSLRRGVDSPSTGFSSTRRKSSRRLTGNAQIPAQESLKRGSGASAEGGLEAVDDGGNRPEVGGAGEEQGRLRSLSASFGEIFGGGNANASNAQSSGKRRRVDGRAGGDGT